MKNPWGLARAAGYDSGMKPLSFLRRHTKTIVPIVVGFYLAWRIARVSSPVVGVLLAGTGILIAIYLYQPAETSDKDDKHEDPPSMNS
jgi:hypothetical protein